MGLIKEPKNVDLTIQSKPWNEDELAELSTIIQKAKKAKKARAKRKSTSRSKRTPPVSEPHNRLARVLSRKLISKQSWLRPDRRWHSEPWRRAPGSRKS